jgi:hypothetical protein
VSEPRAFDYVIVQIVPRVDRDERINVGVIVFCAAARYLGGRLVADEARWRALAPDIDVVAVKRQLDAIRAVVDGDPEAGEIARLSPSERFHWLSAPRSTVVQPGPAHAGVCDDPAATLERIFEAAVA